jgi:hypothetical protein
VRERHSPVNCKLTSVIQTWILGQISTWPGILRCTDLPLYRSQHPCQLQARGRRTEAIQTWILRATLNLSRPHLFTNLDCTVVKADVDFKQEEEDDMENRSRKTHVVVTFLENLRGICSLNVRRVVKGSALLVAASPLGPETRVRNGIDKKP